MRNKLKNNLQNLHTLLLLEKFFFKYSRNKKNMSLMVQQ